MKEIIKLGLILMLICVVASSLLAYTYEVTFERIAEQRNMKNELARKEVFVDADSFELVSEEKLANVTKVSDKIKEIYLAKKAGNVIGYVFKATPSGFGGAIEVVTGIDLNGKITGVRIGNHQETPGLGTNAALPYFYEQYNGLDSISGIGVNKSVPGDNEILAITGATITSAAVTEGVNLGKVVIENIN